MKNYLKTHGIKLGIIVLVVAAVAFASSLLMKGNAGVVRNVSGIVKAPVQNVVGSMANWLESMYGYFYDYDKLVAENEQLRAELTKAQESARNGMDAMEENERLRNLLDFKEKSSDMTLESAKVVSWTSSNWENAFTVSKGSAAGIEVGDCVITEYGVLVGQVTEVGTNWATIRTAIDVDTNIGALVVGSGSSGMLIGEYSAMKDGCAKLSYLPDGAQVFKGDTIVTSGSGGAFPQGIVIGTVTSVESEAGGQVKYGLVKPSCDLSSLVQVFIVKDFEVVE